MKKVATFAAVAVAGAGMAASQATAGSVVASKVTLEERSGAKFSGKVTSPASDCVVGRKVLIYRDEGSSNTKVTKTFASESGKYQVTIPMQSGNTLFAKVKPWTSPLGTECGKDRSKKVLV